MLSTGPRTGHGATMVYLGGHIHSTPVRATLHHLANTHTYIPALTILTPSPPPRSLCHAACVRDRERDGHGDREHMTLHLWVKIICTLQPIAIIFISITFWQVCKSVHQSFSRTAAIQRKYLLTFVLNLAFLHT